ncbi:unnamed protein product [Didymodactylos carnosus]|uniref:Uncharacterized protein n=1 Tax=Didymodactylos carnosus TaxID=1234261 RepID=A0A8S2NRZ2_9BILA|nr:unnamed protein product [Didymodactylos carnosus]CAF4016634.1 unnamed protein product [Didymodactylos carnosus]
MVWYQQQHYSSYDCMQQMITPSSTFHYENIQNEYLHHTMNTMQRRWPNCIDDRKAKSRVAAKHRRSAENKEFTDLSKLLPLQQQIAAQLDKASIIRLTIISSRKRILSVLGTDEGCQLLQSLDGFMFILAADGRILYISESVSSSLGLSMVEMTGNLVFNYVHEDDKKVFADNLGFEVLPPDSPIANVESDDQESIGVLAEQYPKMQASGDKKFLKKSFCIRMKSNLTKRAPNMKTAGYRSVQIVGEYRWLHPSYRKSDITDTNHIIGFVGAALIPCLSPSLNEFTIPEHQHVIKLSHTMHIMHIDEKLQRILNWDITSQYHHLSFYLYVHQNDLLTLTNANRELLTRQQLVLNLIRLQTNIMGHGNYKNHIVGQQWIWCDILATLMTTKTTDENFIILVIEILGLDEGLTIQPVDESAENDYVKRICRSTSSTSIDSENTRLSSSFGNQKPMVEHISSNNYDTTYLPSSSANSSYFPNPITRHTSTSSSNSSSPPVPTLSLSQNDLQLPLPVTIKQTRPSVITKRSANRHSSLINELRPYHKQQYENDIMHSNYFLEANNSSYFPSNDFHQQQHYRHHCQYELSHDQLWYNGNSVGHDQYNNIYSQNEQQQLNYTFDYMNS